MRDLDAGDLEDLGDERLDDREHERLRGERDLDVDLRELGLPIGAQVLVAEALDDLEVAVEAADHQDLLEDLRRLRQREELARMDATRHEVVARALGRALGQDRRLDLEEPALVEVAPDRHRQLVPQDQVLLHPLTTQIEVAIAQARVLGDERLVGDAERRPTRVVEHAQFADADFDLTGVELVVDGLGRSRRDLPEDGDHHLGLELLGLAEQRLGLGDDLRHAVAVADVEKDHRAHVAHAVHPAEEDDLLADVVGTEFTAGVGSVEIAEEVHGQGRREKGEVKRKSKGTRREGTRDKVRDTEREGPIGDSAVSSSSVSRRGAALARGQALLLAGPQVLHRAVRRRRARRRLRSRPAARRSTRRT